jgi:hypothetical protein
MNENIMIMFGELEMIGWEKSWPVLRYYPAIVWRGWGKKIDNRVKIKPFIAFI